LLRNSFDLSFEALAKEEGHSSLFLPKFNFYIKFIP